MDFKKMPIISFQTKIGKELLDNMQSGIVEGITKAEEALGKIEEIDEGGGGGSGGISQETDPTVPAWAKAESKPSYTKSEVGLGNVDNVKQYSASNPPPYPVESVNGQTGKVNVAVPTKVSELTNDAGYAKKTEVPSKMSQLDNDLDYAQLDDLPEVPVKSVNNKVGDVKLSYDDVGAEKSGAVATHNTSADSHSDIRITLAELKAAVEAFLDIDEPTLDQLSELIQAIEANAGSIEQLTNGKVNVSDIVNNLTTNASNKPLSAAQGAVLKSKAENAMKEAEDAFAQAEIAISNASDASAAAANAQQTAQQASSAAQGASDKVDDLEERMDSGEFKGADGKDGISPVLDLLDTEYNALTTEQKIAHYESGKRLISVTEENPNLVPNSISASGDIFNGCGYRNGYRLNSSGAIVAADAAVVTGFIPYVYGNTIQIEGGFNPANAGGQYVATYDASFNLIFANYLETLISNSGGNTVCTDENIRIHTIKTSSFAATTNINGFKTAKYIRVSLAPCTGKRMKVKYV